LQGVDPTAEQAELESEPGWPGSDSTGTMIDADVNSVLTAPAIVTETGTVLAAPATPGAATPTTSAESGGWGPRRFLALLAAALLVTVVVVLVAVAVHNSNDTDPTPSSVVTTEPEPDTAVTTPETTADTTPATAPSSTAASTFNTVVAGSTAAP